MKVVVAVVAALAFAGVLFINASSARAQSSTDPLIAPGEGAAGSLFQVVGQTGWTPGETVTIAVGFSDAQPDASFAGPFYHERQVTVLRDGTWSFPIVVNQDLFPFPLWRPGFIVVKAQSGARTATNSFVYTVEGRAPAGLPPLAALGGGPHRSASVVPLTLALFALATGALIGMSARLRAAVG